MKRIVSKCMLAVLVMSAVPMQAADLSQMFKNGASNALHAVQTSTRNVLQLVAKNPGWTSLISGCALANMVAIYMYKAKVRALEAALQRDINKAQSASGNNEQVDTQEMAGDTASDKALELKKTAQYCCGITVLTGLFALVGSTISKTCGYVGSKI